MGFDSAWTADNAGGIVGVICDAGGSLRSLGEPMSADFDVAAEVVDGWRRRHTPDRTLILLDQPIVVENAAGQRPVENVVAAPVGRRRGAVQPANTARVEMFGEAAPVWRFLAGLGGSVDPAEASAKCAVFETYPVLTLIAKQWLLPDALRQDRLPKYNPARRKTFLLDDWAFVCTQVFRVLSQHGLMEIANWCKTAAEMPHVTKEAQDLLDACLCLIPAIDLVRGEPCLMVGEVESGYMVVPSGQDLERELTARCEATGRVGRQWVRSISL